MAALYVFSMYIQAWPSVRAQSASASCNLILAVALTGVDMNVPLNDPRTAQHPIAAMYRERNDPDRVPGPCSRRWVGLLLPSSIPPPSAPC
ncbi:MAG TPA: hypothetical protein VGN31_16510, partial [Paraburkholderia sp.]